MLKYPISMTDQSLPCPHDCKCGWRLQSPRVVPIYFSSWLNVREARYVISRVVKPARSSIQPGVDEFGCGKLSMRQILGGFLRGFFYAAEREAYTRASGKSAARHLA